MKRIHKVDLSYSRSNLVLSFCSVALLFAITASFYNNDYNLALGQTTEFRINAEKNTFSMIGTIDSLVITVPESGFNITDAFKVILTGEWNLSVDKGKVTNFDVNFLATPMDGSKGHIHQIGNFKSNSVKQIHLANDDDLILSGTVDVKINGKEIWNNVDASVSVSKVNTFAIDLDDGQTDGHFGNQQVYGIVTRVIS